MGHLEELEIFVRIAESGGIGKAADQLGIAKSAISRRLVELEQRLGARLIQRTTRKSSLTEAGQRCYEHAIRVLDSAAELQSAVKEQELDVRGTLRIAAPISFGVSHLPKVLSAFSERYPELNLDVDFSDRFIDLIEGGIDVAIRIGELKDSSLKARRIAPVNVLLVASPGYLKEYGTPQTPMDLERHRLLLYKTDVTPHVHLKDRSGAHHSVSCTSIISANNGDFLNELAIEGQGLIASPDFICWRDIKEGKLVPVLEDYTLASRSVFAVYPNTRFVPQRVRVFIDFMVNYFEQNAYWASEQIS